MFYTLKIKDKEYKCRLNAKTCVDLENKLGTNPLNMLIDISNTNKVPNLSTMIEIFHASLQSAQHGISLDKAYEIYDNYIETGKTLVEFFSDVILGIFKSSGFFNDKQVEGKN